MKLHEAPRYAWCTTHERFWDRTRDCPCREEPLFSCDMKEATGQQKWTYAWQPLDLGDRGETP